MSDGAQHAANGWNPSPPQNAVAADRYMTDYRHQQQLQTKP